MNPQAESWLYQHEELAPFGTQFVGATSLSKALIVSSTWLKTTHPLAVVFQDRAEARSFIDHVKFLVGAERASKIHYIPRVDFDYYKGLFPNPESLTERNLALYHACLDPQGRLFVTTVDALAQKWVPKEAFKNGITKLQTNGEWDRDELALKLVQTGYQRQPVVYDPGCFGVRGGVVDIFSPSQSNPLRVEFYGDLIEQIRFYEPRSQRSLDPIDNVTVIPVGQLLLPKESEFEEAAIRVKQRLDSIGVPKLDRERLIAELKEGVVSAQASYLFPILSNGSESFFSYLPEDAIFFFEGKDRLTDYFKEELLPRLDHHYELFQKELVPVAPFESLFLSESEFNSLHKRDRSYVFETFESQAGGARVEAEPISLAPERETAKQKGSLQTGLEGFARRFKAWMNDGYRIHLVCHTHTHEDRIRLLFEPYSIPVSIEPAGEMSFKKLNEAEAGKLHLWQGTLNESALFPKLHMILLSEEEIFGKKKRTSRSSAWTKTSSASQKLASFRELKEGDYVVHKDHGIGKYLGLKSMSFLGVPNDYVLVEYKDKDKLYVPSYRLNVIQKYVGGEGAKVSLDKMGGDRWEKAKTKAKKATQELAGELIKIQAKRKMTPAHSFEAPSSEYHQFEMAFPFDETPDQQKAIDDAMTDLGQGHPMDRLLVGDVGYGKTEVAMRAAFRCVLGGKQVCVVVPTTVLAFQHFQTFKERFKGTAIEIDMVSRLKKPSENKKTVERAKEGKIDILIGTHRLFSSDVGFKDLQMVIVDEEHRFGVAHKEKLKKLSSAVHYLSMTATPIPRTLNMAMTGLKDISLITTPPPDRMSVRTFVCRRSDEVVSEAITNELARGGQVFFLHNRVETIQNTAEWINELLPKVTVEVVHGQMDSSALEKKMLGFYHADFQVLLTTSIIESGLDIPNANTIIIDRADRLGLAQLYQLRGRVGRSAKRAYCYLLSPPESQLTADAKQRLQVIQRYTDLGAGFNVASYDLEIRGSGDLLGKQQSGHINAIGIDMYFDLLEEAVRHLKGEEVKVEIEPEINLKIAAYFPEDYLPDLSERVVLYRRLSGINNDEAASEIEEEIRDRFGPLPEEVQNLVGLMRIKLYLKRLHATHLNCGTKKASLLFAPSTPVSPEKIVELIKERPGHYAITPDHKFVFPLEATDWKTLLTEVQALSDRLGLE